MGREWGRGGTSKSVFIRRGEGRVEFSREGDVMEEREERSSVGRCDGGEGRVEFSREM